MKPLLAVLAFAALLLSGCYTSATLLLDPTEAQHPLDDGVYVRRMATSLLDRKRVTRSADGWYVIEELNDAGGVEETARVLFNRMSLSGGREGYVFAADDKDEDYKYGVAFAGKDGFFAVQPDCDQALDRDAATDNGGVYDDGNSMQTVCRFSKASDLTASLAAFADQADFGAPYKRQR